MVWSSTTDLGNLDLNRVLFGSSDDLNLHEAGCQGRETVRNVKDMEYEYSYEAVERGMRDLEG
jgi:hypothetical protein